jgi:hypothetical protein
MHRVQVSVSILLLLLVGIAFVVFGLWMWHYAEGEEVTPMAFAGFVFGAVPLLVGSLLCVGACCVAAWQNPWRSQPPHRGDNGHRGGHGSQPQKASITKKVLAVLCYLVGFLLGCLSVILLGLLGLSIYDGTGLGWGVLAWFLVPILSILSFVASRQLWRGAKK